MKLIENTDRGVLVQLSESNLRALLADFDRVGFTDLTKFDQGVKLTVEVRRDDVHYGYDDLNRRGPNWKGAANV
jgi:hypothetical protein